MVLVMDMVVFEGVVVGYETPPGFDEPMLLIQGRVGDVEASFYLVVSREVFEKCLVSGIGKLISGRGVLISEKPIVVRVAGDLG